MASANHLQIVKNDEPQISASLRRSANKLVDSGVAAAQAGDVSALFDLGVAFSTEGHGAYCDLVEAHKWFNLAAARGHEAAKICRAEISDEMTAREINEAQRQARAWLSRHSLRAA